MKTKKITLIALGLMILVVIAGCTPSNTGYNTRLGTQTRVGLNTPSGNGAMPDNNLGTRNLVGQNTMLNRNTGFGLNDGWNNGMNTGFNNGLNTGLNNGFNDGYNNSLNYTGFNNTGLTTNIGNMGTNARDLARRIGTLPEVTSATVVTSNNKAVVGLKLRNNQTLGTALRQRIETMVRDTNSNITNVSITTDPNLFTRIQNMSNGITNGGMMNTLGNDIEDLIRRITPTNNINR